MQYIHIKYACMLYICALKYLFLLMGSFLGLAKIQGAGGWHKAPLWWLQSAFGYRAACLQVGWWGWVGRGAGHYTKEGLLGRREAVLGCAFPPLHHFSCFHRDAHYHGCCSEPIVLMQFLLHVICSMSFSLAYLLHLADSSHFFSQNFSNLGWDGIPAEANLV